MRRNYIQGKPLVWLILQWLQITGGTVTVSYKYKAANWRQILLETNPWG